MASYERNGMTDWASRALFAMIAVAVPALYPNTAFAQARAIRARPAVSGLRAAGYAPLPGAVLGGISAAVLAGPNIKADFLSPIPGLAPRMQVAPATPEAAARQAERENIMAFGQLAAAAIPAPQMEKQDNAEFNAGSAQAFDGLKVKPGSGGEAVAAEAGGAAAAAAKPYRVTNRRKISARVVKKVIKQPLGFYRLEAKGTTTGARVAKQPMGFYRPEVKEPAVDPNRVKAPMGFYRPEAQAPAAKVKRVQRPIGFNTSEAAEPAAKAKRVQRPIGFNQSEAQQVAPAVKSYKAIGRRKVSLRTAAKAKVVKRPIGFYQP